MRLLLGSAGRACGLSLGTQVARAGNNGLRQTDVAALLPPRPSSLYCEAPNMTRFSAFAPFASQREARRAAGDTSSSDDGASDDGEDGAEKPRNHLVDGAIAGAMVGSLLGTRRGCPSRPPPARASLASAVLSVLCDCTEWAVLLLLSRSHRRPGGGRCWRCRRRARRRQHRGASTPTLPLLKSQLTPPTCVHPTHSPSCRCLARQLTRSPPKRCSPQGGGQQWAATSADLQERAKPIKSFLVRNHSFSHQFFF